MAERTEPLKLSNKDIREAFEHMLNYLDTKYGVWYDDSYKSLRDFQAWMQNYVIEPTNEVLETQRATLKPARKQ